MPFLYALPLAIYVLIRFVPSPQLPPAVSRVIAALCIYVIGENVWSLLFFVIYPVIRLAIGGDVFRFHPYLMIFAPPLLPAVVIARLMRIRGTGRG